jgi:hypothetical protein
MVVAQVESVQVIILPMLVVIQVICHRGVEVPEGIAAPAVQEPEV